MRAFGWAAVALLLLSSYAMAATARLTWDHDGKRVLGFAVFYDTQSHASVQKPENQGQPGPYAVRIDASGVDTRTVTVELPDEPMTYYFRLIAYNEYGESLFSPEVSGQVIGIPPNAPHTINIVIISGP